MDQIKIGAFRKELRKEKDLSQEQLAERLNVSSGSVSKWENGNTMPDISLMIEKNDSELRIQTTAYSYSVWK